MSGGDAVKAGNRGMVRAHEGAAGGATVPRFAPNGLGLERDGAAGPHFNEEERQP